MPLPALAHVRLSTLILARPPAVSPGWRFRAAGRAKDSRTLQNLRQSIFLFLFLGFSRGVRDGRVVCRYGFSHGNSTGEGKRVLALEKLRTDRERSINAQMVIDPNRHWYSQILIWTDITIYLICTVCPHPNLAWYSQIPIWTGNPKFLSRQNLYIPNIGVFLVLYLEQYSQT